MTAADTYNLIRYDNFPLPQTHPSRLHALGKMAGMNPPPIESCRVLELGASEGVNLIPMAHRFPRAEFIGIDLAAEPIERGKKFVREFGLGNLRLATMDLLDVGASFGTFDYILAHGLYAWTPEIVKDKILAIMGTQLSPQGIGFISYNTQPAGHIRRMVRCSHCLRASAPGIRSTRWMPTTPRWQRMPLSCCTRDRRIRCSTTTWRLPMSRSL